MTVRFSLKKRKKSISSKIDLILSNETKVTQEKYRMVSSIDTFNSGILNYDHNSNEDKSLGNKTSSSNKINQNIAQNRLESLSIMMLTIYSQSELS